MEALLVQHVNQQERERAQFGGLTQSAAAAPTEVRVTLRSLLEFLEGTVPSACLDKGKKAPPTNPNAGLPAVRGPSVRIGLSGEALARRLFTETQITLLVLLVHQLRAAGHQLARHVSAGASNFPLSWALSSDGGLSDHYWFYSVLLKPLVHLKFWILSTAAGDEHKCDERLPVPAGVAAGGGRRGGVGGG